MLRCLSQAVCGGHGHPEGGKCHCDSGYAVDPADAMNCISESGELLILTPALGLYDHEAFRKKTETPSPSIIPFRSPICSRDIAPADENGILSALFQVQER